MKKIGWILILVFAVGVAGCAKKTASEQLSDDLKKASSDLKKEVNKL